MIAVGLSWPLHDSIETVSLVWQYLVWVTFSKIAVITQYQLTQFKATVVVLFPC